MKSIGHADLVDTPDGHWWAVYLGTRHYDYGAFSLGRETFLAPVKWEDGWPTVKPKNMYYLTVHEQTLPLHPWPAQPERDDFNSLRLGLAWNLLSIPMAAKPYSLTARAGYLRLLGNAGTISDSNQVAFVGRRQAEWAGTASTLLEFTPTKDKEEAGITVFMKNNYHYDLYKTRVDGKLIVALRKSVGDIQTVTATAEIGDGPLRLKIDASPATYQFFYADKDGDWKLLGSGLTRLIASEVADVWSGAYIGMYSTSNGQGSASPADFDWFDYHPVHAEPVPTP